jgi:hypothetical protein
VVWDAQIDGETIYASESFPEDFAEPTVYETYGLTYTDLAFKARARYPQASPGAYRTHIEDAVRRFLYLTRSGEEGQATIALVANQEAYALPQDFLSIRRNTVDLHNTIGTFMQPLVQVSMDDVRADHTTPAQQPTSYYFPDRWHIAVFPVPSVSDAWEIHFRYDTGLPVTLAADAVAPVDPLYEGGILDYAIAQVALGLGTEAGVMRYQAGMRSFEAAVAQCRADTPVRTVQNTQVTPFWTVPRTSVREEGGEE